MSRETSVGTGKPYGLERACRVLELPRSTIYAQQARETAVVVPLLPMRRGPQPKILDTDRLAAMRIETVDEGWVWVFSAGDHVDACCIGIPAVKIGNRFAAWQPIAQDLLTEFGATGADAGRGLALRMDHGNPIHGRRLSQPGHVLGGCAELRLRRRAQTNGVAERFNRTLKEQAIHGRVFRNVEEVRVTVTEFKDRYNHHWRLEKRGFM